jgi:hypothetical protein
MSLIVQQKLCFGRGKMYLVADLAHSISIIGNGAEHCEKWFDAILHRKIAIVSSSSDVLPEGLHANEEGKRQVTEKFKTKRHLIITNHIQSLTSFPELLVKLGTYDSMMFVVQNKSF